MQEEHVPNVCKVGTHHKNDFDEVMPIVHVSSGNCEIMDVLLDGGSRVNIIFEHLWKKPQSMPFMVRMAYQRKVQPIRLIQNLKIDLTRCTFKILVTVLEKENIPKTYSILLRRPRLKQVKAHHDWGNNTLTIIVDIKTMTLSTERWVMVHPSQRPCNLDDYYDWEGGLIDGDEECLYHAIPKLWFVGKVCPE
jgi:hypothetical protein